MVRAPPLNSATLCDSSLSMWLRMFCVVGCSWRNDVCVVGYRSCSTSFMVNMIRHTSVITVQVSNHTAPPSLSSKPHIASVQCLDLFVSLCLSPLCSLTVPSVL